MNWIKCSEELPPKDKPFLGYVKVGFHCEDLFDTRFYDIQTCRWDVLSERFYEDCNCSGNERDQEYIEVIEWMPRPLPPE
jgi:hypothetical protein